MPNDTSKIEFHKLNLLVLGIYLKIKL